PEAPAPSPSGPIVHTVQNGEWIYSIARQYNVAPDAIIRANSLANANLIHPGQQLIIPQP
ncbi:MAG: LysM peptidoglycan-binding domain-containing protein, partial [Ardenticatenaceae bacterium]